MRPCIVRMSQARGQWRVRRSTFQLQTPHSRDWSQVGSEGVCSSNNINRISRPHTISPSLDSLERWLSSRSCTGVYLSIWPHWLSDLRKPLGGQRRPHFRMINLIPRSNLDFWPVLSELTLCSSLRHKWAYLSAHGRSRRIPSVLGCRGRSRHRRC